MLGSPSNVLNNVHTYDKPLTSSMTSNSLLSTFDADFTVPWITTRVVDGIRFHKFAKHDVKTTYKVFSKHLSSFW